MLLQDSAHYYLSAYLLLGASFALSSQYNGMIYAETSPGNCKVATCIHPAENKKYFSGDGSTFTQWIELFPYMTTAGDAVLDVASIVKKAKSTGVTHFFVEQDRVDKPEIALKRSIDFLKTV